MPKVSVVVPIYKVEKYIRECVDSIVNQSLKDIEIILVDDGSPDGCPAICDEYAAKDSRIKVIHKKNGGYGTACNRGIAEATGEYIGLVESDDWIEPTMYEKLYNQITKFDADVCIGSFYEYKSDSTFPNGLHDKPFMETIENIDDTKLFSIMDFPFLYTVHQSVWSKLYKKELIKTVKFDEQPGASYQDGPFITEVFCKTNKLIGLKDFLYHYRVDNEYSSANNKNKSKRLMTVLDQMQVAKDTLKKYGMFEKLREEFFFQASKAGLRFYRNIDKKYRKEFFKKWQEFAKEIKDDKTFTFKYFNPKRKHILQSILNNDYRASIYDSYSSINLFGVPLFEITSREGNVKKRLLSIPICVETRDKNYKIKKLLFGLAKVKKDRFSKKYYLLGVQIFRLSNSSMQYYTKGNSDIENFMYYNKLAELVHPKIFEQYKNVNFGKDCVLCACGPSVNYYSKLDNVKHISVNRAIFNEDIKFNVLFMHDAEFVIENTNLLRSYDAEKFCAFHTYRRNANKYNISSEYIGYINAKRFILSNPGYRGVEQQFPDVINPDISKGMFYDRGGGTVFSALQFILYTHPKRIYLVGCDCSSDGYFYSNRNDVTDKYLTYPDIKNGVNDLLPLTIQLWHDAAVSIKMLYPDIEIISINPVGLKGLFKDVYTQSYVDSHPELKDQNIEILTNEKEIINV